MMATQGSTVTGFKADELYSSGPTTGMSAMWSNGAMGGSTVHGYSQGRQWRLASNMTIHVCNVPHISVVIPALHDFPATQTCMLNSASLWWRTWVIVYTSRRYKLGYARD